MAIRTQLVHDSQEQVAQENGLAGASQPLHDHELALPHRRLAIIARGSIPGGPHFFQRLPEARDYLALHHKLLRSQGVKR